MYEMMTGRRNWKSGCVDCGVNSGGLLRAGQWIAFCALFVMMTFGGVMTAVASGDHSELFERLSPEQEAEVIELLDLAEEAYDDGDFRTALARFNEVYAIFPHPDVLYRIGLCYERLGNDEMAIQHYRQFLEEVPDAPERGRIERTIAVIEERIGEGASVVRIETFPIGAQLHVDDDETAPVGESPADITLSPGNYVVIIKKEGYKTERQPVQLERGDRLRYQIRLTETDTQEPRDSSVGWWQPAISVGLAGMGGLALYRAAGHRAQRLDYEAQIAEMGGQPSDPQLQQQRDELVDRRDEERTMGLVMGTLGAVSMVSAVVFTAWWIIRDTQHRASVGVAPTEDGIAVGVFGRF